MFVKEMPGQAELDNLKYGLLIVEAI